MKQLIDRTGVEKETEYISSETLQKEKFEEKCPKLNLKVILANLSSKLVILSQTGWFWSKIESEMTTLKSKMIYYEVEMTFFGSNMAYSELKIVDLEHEITSIAP